MKLMDDTLLAERGVGRIRVLGSNASPEKRG